MANEDHQSGSSGIGSGIPFVRIGLLVAVYLIATLPLIFGDSDVGRGGYDQVNYHQPTIEGFVEEWPAFDFSDYRSATTPAYHVFVATVARVLGGDERVMRLAGLVVSLILLSVLVIACTRRDDDPAGFFRALPFACSLYVFSSAAWLLPDNAAWLGILTLLLVCLRGSATWRTALFAGAVLLLLVLTRQIHIWAASMLWALGWLGGGNSPHSKHLLTDPLGRVPRMLLFIGASLPAAAALWYFVDLWGGLVVPRYQNMYSGLSPATPAFVLALFGGFGVFFAADLVPRVLIAWKQYRSFVILSVLVGLGSALIPATNWSFEGGRFSGLWNVAHKIEEVVPLLLVGGRTSLLIVGLSCLGSLWVASIILSMQFRARWIVLGAVSGFIAAQSASPMLWQRYNEPFVLMLLAVLLSKPIHRAHWEDNPVDPAVGPLVQPALGPALVPVGRVLGPVMLALVLAIYTGMTLVRASDNTRTEHDPVIERTTQVSSP